MMSSSERSASTLLHYFAYAFECDVKGNDMRFNSTSWFQGWQIILRCAVFNCNDGVRKYASTAILRYMPTPTDCTSLHWPVKVRRSIVFPEMAFRTREAANADATDEAQREIMKLNGSPRVGESKR